MSSCGVSSSVLDSLHNLTSLLILDLSRNQLTQIIPKSLCSLCNLKDISLSENDFRGISLTYLLQSLFKCKAPVLEFLDLSSLGLSGAIPDFIGKLSFLRTLKLGSNLISGPIPFSIGKLTSLEVLHLDGNQMNGRLPDWIGNFSSLKQLYIPYNKFDGTLPESLGQLSKLEDLLFEFNMFTGVVTETHFAKLVSLKFLVGGGNNLVLRLPLGKWSPPFQLGELVLNSWNLGHQFPLWLESQKDLFLLDISNTSISSSMPPESFWRSLPSLNSLDMSHNHIKGMLSSIPATVATLFLNSNHFSGMLPNLSNVSRHLDLSNNFFEGSLHNLLCPNEEKYLEALNLGNNHLSGVIPDCWQKIPEMEFLNLENNNLSGHIPRTLGSSYKLQFLNMHGNKLSGRLPSSLKNLTDLKCLILSGNELVGIIPAWLGRELSFLHILDLRSNSFDGNIPHEICYLTHIKILVLADNDLSGNIPRCFNKFSILSGKEFGYYSDYHVIGYSTGIVSSASLVIKGREDTYISILQQVMLLDLSNNNLSGNIPSELTALTALQALNLSR
ncbi:leucine-rich repeat protein, partial [Tanacetum coccineum]